MNPILYHENGFSRSIRLLNPSLTFLMKQNEGNNDHKMIGMKNLNT
ncbi:hypothetical protein SLEP1_g24344 [Rubroshorea leprosula]|uniref:Ycf15 n=1 Tax=Rubroshorea leprosula TaxID=152421 RepID=A0AAV5JIE9_9ROSI|nr:hypothetical protein SLEP1_g24344 [Rubroshorea leprosula]